MNPLDKFRQEKQALEKRAGFMSSFTKQIKQAPEVMGHAMATGAATAAVGVGMTGMGLAAHKIYEAMTKRQDFNSMMSANPDLAEHHAQDPKRFNMMFTSLRSMNPTFSADPVVAGTYMRRMVESPLSAGGIAVEALGYRTPPALSEAFTRAGLEGAKQKHDKPEHPLQGLRDQAEQSKLQRDLEVDPLKSLRDDVEHKKLLRDQQNLTSSPPVSPMGRRRVGASLRHK